MPIKFHCEHCGKSISAPDDAGGKKGRCPSCKETVYVPAAQADELGLAPLDDEEERRRKQLVEDSLRREHDLLAAQARRDESKEPPPNIDDPHGEGGIALPEVPQPSAAGNLREMVLAYLSHMTRGRLDMADAVVKQLLADPKAARAAISQVQADPARDPRVASVPAPVLNGFLRQLLQQLK
ncbi:MAG: hypothetical protein PHU85_19125 [Phycisphaerae bacterium]|nr:hypothetical protein [Phycisphaerae bacterium]